jgi:hypothetical protein
MLRPTYGTPRHRLAANHTYPPWSSSVVTKFLTLGDTDTVGAIAISLSNKSLAPSTYANYDSALR